MSLSLIYARHIEDGHVWIVEVEDGWIPKRAFGPIRPDVDGRHPLDESPEESAAVLAPTDATTWNWASLVPICEQERRLLINGALPGHRRRLLPKPKAVE